MKLRTSLWATTAAIALCAASTAQAADPYISFFGGVSTFDDEVQFDGSNYNPGFFGSAFGFSTPVAGGVKCIFYHPTVTTLCLATGIYRVDGNFFFGSGKYGTSDFSWEDDFDSGYVVGGALGAMLANGFRAELELAYRAADVEGGGSVRNRFAGRNIKTGHVTGDYNLYTFPKYSAITTGVPIGPVTIPVTAQPPGFPFSLNLPTQTTRNGTFSSDGDVAVWSLMANVWLDIDPFGINPDGVTTFVGGGVGMANLELDYGASWNTLLGGSMSYSLNDNENAWAYQLGAGIGFDLGGGMMLSAQYRWFATDDVDLGSRDMRVESHNAVVGLTVPFGNLLP